MTVPTDRVLLKCDLHHVAKDNIGIRMLFSFFIVLIFLNKKRHRPELNSAHTLWVETITRGNNCKVFRYNDIVKSVVERIYTYSNNKERKR